MKNAEILSRRKDEIVKNINFTSEAKLSTYSLYTVDNSVDIVNKICSAADTYFRSGPGKLKEKTGG